MRQLYLLVFSLTLLTAAAIGQDCEVKSSFTPFKDTMVVQSTPVTFNANSTGGTIYTWIVDIYDKIPGATLGYYFDPGVHLVRLVTSNGACSDTTAPIKVIVQGTQPPGEVFKSFYGPEDRIVTPKKIIATSDNGYVIASEHTGLSYVSNSNLYLLKINGRGCIEWSKTIYGVGNHGENAQVLESIYSIKETTDKGFIFIGFANTHSDSSSQFITKLDKNGNTQWTKALPPAYAAAIGAVFSDIIATPEGYVLAGQANEFATFETEAALLHVDLQGNILWSKFYKRSIYEYFYSLAYKDGFIYACGSTRRKPIDAYDNKYYGFVTKVDSKTGNSVWNKMYAGSDNLFFFNICNYGNNFLLGYNDGDPSYCIIDPNGTTLASKRISVDIPMVAQQYKVVALPEGEIQILIQGRQTLNLQPYYQNYSAVIKVSAQHNVIWSKQYSAYGRYKFLDIDVTQDKHVGVLSDQRGMTERGYWIDNTFAFLNFNSNGNSITCDINNVNAGIWGAYFTESNFSWTSESPGINLTSSARINNKKIYTSQRYDCAPYLNFCSDVIIAGPDTVCNIKKVYDIKVQKGEGCLSPLTLQYNPASFQVISQTDTVIKVRLLRYGTFNFKVQLQSECILASDSISITAIEKHLPKINLGPDLKICAGIEQKVSAGAGFDTYLWQDGSTDSTFIIKSPGTYHVLATDLCGNEYRDTINVTASNAILVNAGPDLNKCNMDSLRLNAPAGFVEYKWSPDYNILNAQTQNPTVFPVSDTAYILTAKNAQGCIGFDTIRVKVNTSPAINLGNDTTLCDSQQILLNAGTSFKSYLWSNGNSTSTIKVQSAGTYSVVAKDVNNCISSDTIKISILTSPVFSLGSDTALCSGDRLLLQANVPGSYLWQNGSAQQQQTIITPGIYWLQVNNGGCTSTDSIVITYKPVPIFNLGNDTTICEGTSKTIAVNPPYTSVLWQNNTTTPVYSVSDPGIYYAKVTLNGCTSTDTIQIFQKLIPRFSLGNDTFLCIGQTLPLKVNVPNASYLWNTGSASSTYTVTSPGTYRVTATNECGSSTDDIVVTIGVCDIIMPTAFTPNGDGLNDEFRIKYPQSIKSMVMRVFNRFGQLIYSANNPFAGWNGTINSIPVDSGNYIWTITYESIDGTKGSLKGNVLLIR